MKSTTSITLSLAGLVSTVVGHGFVTEPQARMPGTAMAAACGEQVEINQSSDNYGNVQGELQIAANQADYNEAECDIWLCKGFKFEDNQDNVQSLTAGQVLPITVEIRAPHTGVANVSIVKTSSNTVIGEPLISWDEYASNAATIPEDQTNFEVTIPDNLGSECATAGDCVIQWYWDAPDIDQTYESCIDFTVAGSGSGDSSPAPSSTQGTSTLVTSTAVPQTSTVAPEATTATAPSTTPTTTAVPFIAASAIPSSMLTSVIPTALPTGTGAPTQALAEGTTVQDLVDWINYLMSSAPSTTKRHARDFLRSRRH